jgi:hypothetical protein
LECGRSSYRLSGSGCHIVPAWNPEIKGGSRRYRTPTRLSADPIE